MPTLTIQLPGFPPVEHVLRDEMMTIGRMKGNSIALDDPSVSVSHAKITRKGAEFFVKDLNSTNGTMLNGQSINEARLRDGDQIKFGEVIAYYHGEPAFAVAGMGSNAGANAAPAQQSSMPAPPATPQPPLNPSTSFVSKRLASQAALPSSPNPAIPPFTRSRGSKRQGFPVGPVIGGIAALVIAAVLGRMFFGEPENAPSRGSPAMPAAKPTPKDPAPNQNIAQLRAALKSSAVTERRRAAASLHSLGGDAREAVSELRNALTDSDQDVRMWSALALINNKSYDKAAIPILVQTLQHENTMLRQVACLSLALIPYEPIDKETVVTALTDTANKDSDEEVRNAAVSALKIIAPEVISTGK
jgi:predicted component of type VI protein secretion system